MISGADAYRITSWLGATSIFDQGSAGSGGRPFTLCFSWRWRCTPLPKPTSSRVAWGSLRSVAPSWALEHSRPFCRVPARRIAVGFLHQAWVASQPGVQGGGPAISFLGTYVNKAGTSTFIFPSRA